MQLSVESVSRGQISISDSDETSDGGNGREPTGVTTSYRLSAFCLVLAVRLSVNIC